MNNNNSIGAFIAALRKANGLTQKQLAEKLNVSDKAVSRWERDECAPDLSLIPVMAEMFGITCDELLRGQRANPDAAPTPQAEEKSKKRLQYLLSQISTRYKIQSLISVAIAVAGLIAAMILNAFIRAQAGFLVGCIFFLAAIICQIIFLTLSRAKLSQEDFDEAAVTACRHGIIKGAEWVFSIIAILTFAAAPLTLAGDPHWGLTIPYWWTTSFAFMAVPAIVCPIVCFIVNGKLGIRKPLSQKGKLRLRSLCVLLPVILVTALLHLLAGVLLSENRYLYSPGTKFDTFEAFKAHMETPLSFDGEPLTLYERGTGYIIYADSEDNHYCADYFEYITGDPETGFYDANKTVAEVCQAKDAIYTYDFEQNSQAQIRFTVIMLLIAIVYPVEIAVAILIYRKKAKVTQE